MRILLVDDEFPTRECLRRLLADTDGGHELAGEASDVWEAIEHCRTEPIDLVLLDSQISGMSGAEAARQLATLERPPTVVFLTANGESSPAMVERRVAGSLLKPIRRERLQEILRLARILSASGDDRHDGAVDATLKATRRSKVSARYRGKVCTVAIPDIIYLQADQKYVNVRHLGGELLVDDSLRSFEQEFPDLFLRIHRNALVARARLSGLNRQPDGSILAELLDCEERLPVSRRHLAEVRRWLQQRDDRRRLC
ncbi:LytR/AlgR family response regulator transcription factor [Thiocystis violacea]|uniref:LytR/AlgR family response regulator transcription factor n=1 Tax=Thiocystis violacea TaxID=13725 RepID=UPI00190791FF|nr:LytTR family DNA-binding domain-containing protein [Thiocystis violacea]MBK1722479.1 DNA-binding response regulator [Thiocystis violacea]